MKFLPIVLVVLTIGFIIVMLRRARNVHRAGYSRIPSVLVMLVGVMLLLGAAFVVNRADSAEAQPAPPPDSGDGMPKPVAPAGFTCTLGDSNNIGELNYGQNDPNTLKMRTADGGELVGNGPPVDQTTRETKIQDLYNRTWTNPKLTATILVAMRAPGYVPLDADGKPIARDSNEIPNGFIDSMTADLVSNHEQWKQARSSVCFYLTSAPPADPATETITEGALFEMATKVSDPPAKVKGNVSGQEVELPVLEANATRTASAEDTIPVLWLQAEETSDGGGEVTSGVKYKVGIDLDYAWPFLVGPSPTDAVICVPALEQPTEIQEENTAKKESQSSANQQKAQSTSGDGGGSSSSGGGAGDCGGPCPGGGGDSGGGGDCNGCPAPTTSPPAPPCVGCQPPSTTAPPPVTTSPPPVTTVPPTAPPTTAPPTTAPPTTQPPTTPPTTKPNPTTTTTVIPCPPWAC